MTEKKWIGNKEKLRRANQKIVFLIKENKKKEAENADLQKSVEEIYEDYQDVGKKMFEYAEKVEQLETNNKNLIEKLEDLINNKFRAFFEGNTEFANNATKMEIVKYVKVTDLQEILRIAKGEKE